jgi:[ribosomal protein S5]-alanine N-acetyltransferase
MVVARLPEPFVLRTPRLQLRHFQDADADFIVRLLNDSSFLRFIGDRGVRNIVDARAYLAEGPIESYRRFGFGLLRVSLKAGAEPLGMCGLTRKAWLDDPDIGYAFLPEATSKGYAFEAASAVLEHARGELSIRRIVAVVTRGNAASIRVLEKLGLQFERMILDPAGVELKLFAG